MRRSVRAAVVLTGAAIWIASSCALYPVVVANRCLDAGGARDAVTGMCIGAPWSSDPSLIASLSWPAWLFVIGFPGACVVALVLLVFRLLGRASDHAP